MCTEPTAQNKKQLETIPNALTVLFSLNIIANPTHPG